ncbi:hypothetical protein QQ054_11600 [Oscillatoria amoena NRMC-F 0135]|nr:hypothetical protein [Oscillatoria amoena NRMC-F 0135]
MKTILAARNSIIATTYSLLFILSCFTSAHATNIDTLSEPFNGRFYFYWGYNRGIFSASDIHVKGPGYDFTVYNVKSKDHAENPSLVYLNPKLFTIPQFNVRLGYHITKRWAISLGYDHMKYVMQNNRMANVSGVINAAASKKYAGTYLQTPVYLDTSFLKFEHTDGLNIVTIDAEYLLPIWKHKRNKWRLEATIGTGGVWIIPRSDVRVLSKGLNNRFHMAGYTWTGKAGFRINGYKRFFFQMETRGGYISLPSVLVANDAPDIINHNFTFLEFTGMLGIRF